MTQVDGLSPLGNELLMETIRHELKKANTAWEEKKAAGLDSDEDSSEEEEEEAPEEEHDDADGK